jgi:hypothetical protein
MSIKAAKKAAPDVRRRQAATTATAVRKVKAVVPAPVEEPAVGTMAWRLARIAALGSRIEEHVVQISKVADLKSSSAEAKNRAVIAFHDRLAALEAQLGRIHEELQLG